MIYQTKQTRNTHTALHHDPRRSLCFLRRRTKWLANQQHTNKMALKSITNYLHTRLMIVIHNKGLPGTTVHIDLITKHNISQQSLGNKGQQVTGVM